MDENIVVCDRVNGDALATGMVWVMCVPWTICACLYGVLHFTYPRDRRRVLARAGEDGEGGALSGGPAAEKWSGEGGEGGGDECCGCCGGGGRRGSREEYTPLADSDTV